MIRILPVIFPSSSNSVKMNQHQLKPQQLHHQHIYPGIPTADLASCNNHHLSGGGVGLQPVTHNNAAASTTSTTQTGQQLERTPGDKSYKCDICSKTFAHSYSLQRHTRTHTGDKPFKCDICSKLFTAKSSLQRHLNSHTGEKPFKCHICSKAFTRKNILNRHSRTHTTITG